MSNKDRQTSSFGNSWETFERPETEAIVGVIDRDGNNDQVSMLGLSVRQLRNLGTERQLAPSTYDQEMFMKRVVERANKGLLSGENYGKVTVIFNERTAEALVYYAFGLRAMDGSQVRLSIKLAESLGVKAGEVVSIKRDIEPKKFSLGSA